MEYVGYPAAATLGFVTDNVRGAIGATRLYHAWRTRRVSRNPTNQMPPVPSAFRSRVLAGRKRASVPYGRTNLGPYNPKKRRMMAAALPKKKKRTVARGKSKTSLVSRVRQILNRTEPTGRYIKVGHQQMVQNATNKERVFEFYHKTSEDILDAVAVLFNGKTPSMTYVAAGNFSDTKMNVEIESYTSKLYVRHCHMTPVTLDVYICKPKINCLKTAGQAWDESLTALTTGGFLPTKEDPYVTHTTGSSDLKRAYTVYHKKVKIGPAENKLVFSRNISTKTIQVEDFYIGTTLQRFIKGMTDVIMIKQSRPTNGTSTGVYQGISTQPFRMIAESVDDFKIKAPENATVAQSVDKLLYLNDLETTLGTPWVQQITPSQSAISVTL